MATLVLGAVGSSFAGPVGGFVGSALGSVIDSQFLMPALFPQKGLEGNKIDDRGITVASEGTPANWIIGPKNPAAGTVIWKSDLIIEHKEESVGKGGGGATTTTSSVFVDIAVAFAITDGLAASGVSRIKKIFGGSKVIYGDDESSRYEEITIYLGDQTSPDPLLEAYLGAGSVPTYKKTCYVVFKKLALADFGNSIPSFRAEVEEENDVSAAEAIEKVLVRYGFDSSEYDTSRVSACFLGMIVSGPQPGKSALEPILVANSIGVQESNGQLVFFQRGEEQVVSTDSMLFGAHEESSDPEEPIELTAPPDENLPKEVNVTFTSTEIDLQQGSEREIRVNLDSSNVVSMDLPLTLKPETARSLARKVLWSAEAERHSVRTFLPPSMIHVQEGDVLSTTIDGREYQIYVTSMTRGANWILEISGVLTQQQVYTQQGVAQERTAGTNRSGDRNTDFVVFDAPPMTEEVAGMIGVYFGISRESSADSWVGGQLWNEDHQGEGYRKREIAPGEAVLGKVLSPPSAQSEAWLSSPDDSLIVELSVGQLESCSEAEWLSGSRNRAAIQCSTGEWEIIGYLTATLIGTLTYRLSGLLRGLRGTEHLIPYASAGGRFAYLSEARMGFRKVGSSSLHRTEYYKAPATGSDVSYYPYKTVVCTGVTMRPFSVTHLKAEMGPRDKHIWASSDDFTISVNTGNNSYDGPVGFFSRLRIGDYVTVSGWSTSTNNGTFKINSIESDGSKLYPDVMLSSEPAVVTPHQVTFSSGSENDIKLTWIRRSKVPVDIFQGAPMTDDESPLRFLVEARRGGEDLDPLRTWEVDNEEIIYTQQQQLADNLGLTNHIVFTVRQRSQKVGYSIPVAVDVYISGTGSMGGGGSRPVGGGGGGSGTGYFPGGWT